LPFLWIHPMPSISIYLHEGRGPDFSTSDTGTVEALRKALPDAESILVPAYDLAPVLRSAGRAMWAGVLERMEEPSVVRVVFDHYI
jgi:hypothetical protein